MREYVELKCVEYSAVRTYLRQVPGPWVSQTQHEKGSLLSTRHDKLLNDNTFIGLFSSRIISLSLPEDVHASVLELELPYA